MEMVREVAFVNDRGAMPPDDFAFAVEAIRTQLCEHFLPAWQNYLPVKRPLEICGYTDSKDLAPGSFAPIQIVRTLDVGILGDHGGLEASDSAWGRSLPDSVVMSHEALELACDPFSNRWVRLPDGMVVALECCDAVENDRNYFITVTIGGVSRDVEVSNFVHPAWFGEGQGQIDHLGLCKDPGENRGYIIVEEPDGSTVNVFASRANGAYRTAVQSKLGRISRTARRHGSAHRTIIEPGKGEW